MPGARDLTNEEIALYRATARQQQRAERLALVRREERAWELARRAAVLLRDELHAQDVVVFGSLVHPGCFTRWSDVDIAAHGIDARDTLRAMEMVRDLSADIPVSLVDLSVCSDSLRRVIERDGVPV
jgi:predicted nucleotidyltransferase